MKKEDKTQIPSLKEIYAHTGICRLCKREYGWDCSKEPTACGKCIGRMAATHRNQGGRG